MGWGGDYRPSLRSSFADEAAYGTGEFGHGIEEQWPRDGAPGRYGGEIEITKVTCQENKSP